MISQLANVLMKKENVYFTHLYYYIRKGSGNFSKLVKGREAHDNVWRTIYL